jgi:2-polyprenyl-3-methyl-5-hydroxy-6-metoxy-1,4-benzoquinol methylase
MLFHEISCNLCGESHVKVVEEDQLPFRVLKCTNCSLVFVYPHPSNTDLKDHYDDNYYKEWLDIQKEKRGRMWANRLQKLEKMRLECHLLDVGCGEGTFLKLAQKNGWQITGTELSSYAAKYAANILGKDIFCGELPDAKFSENSFDIVTMWHVLEHVGDPKTYLKEAHRILKPNGLLVVAVPNVNDLIMQIAYRIIRQRKVELFTKGEKEIHLYHFSPKTLKRYLNETGFKCLKLSPDFGIVESSKKLVNMISVIPYYFAGIKIFNAIEAYAIPK